MASSLFTGSSRYSQDFSAVIERSVGIASLSLTQMQQARTKSSDELTATKSLQTKISALQSTLASIETSIGTNAWQTTSTDSSIIKATTADGAAAGSYSVQVTSLGSFSNAVSKTSVSSPTSGNFVTAGTSELTLRVIDRDATTPTTTDKKIRLTGTTLQAVVDSINGTVGLDVRAAVVNTGTSSSPSYALTLQETKLGKLAIQLKNGTTNLMDVDETNVSDPSLGARAQYKVNGATVKSDSRNVTLAPGVTAELLKADTTRDVTVNVSRTTSSFTTSINAFIAAYNAVMSELDTHSGKSGALTGNAILNTIRTQLRASVTSASSSGNLPNMASIGLELTREGTLKLNTDVFNSQTSGKFDSLAALIGTSKTTGFVKNATDLLNSLTKESSGILTSAVAWMDEALKLEDERIAAERRRVEQFTTDLQERMARADALIAQLEQQATYMNNMFEAMRANQKSMS